MLQGIASNQAYFPQFFMMGAVAQAPSFGYQQPMMGQMGQYGGQYALMQSQRLEALFAGFAGAQGYGQMGQMGYGQMGYGQMNQMGYGQMGMIGVVGVFGGQQRIEDDPNGVNQSGQGLKSNLANSPEAMLALKDMFSQNSSMSLDDAAKQLKEKYGIQAEVGEISSVAKDGKEVKGKGIKLGNGDYFVDGNGNGVGDMGDYKFDDAVKSLKEKYNLDDDALKAMTERLKTNGPTGFGSNQGFAAMGIFGMQGMQGMQGMGWGNQGMGFGMQGMQGMQGMGFGMPGMQGMHHHHHRPMPGLFNPMMNYNWMNMFGAAFGYAA